MGLQLTLILTCLFFYKALALTCYQQTLGKRLGTCTQTDGGVACARIRVMSTLKGAGAPLVDLKLSCTAPAECINGSINLGLVKTVLSTKCCKTNLCNRQTVPDLPEQPPNGKHCYTCDGYNCSGTIKCHGDENQCISTSGGKKMTMKGCATKTICNGITSYHRTMGMMKMSCCVGNLCNSGNMVNLSFLLMLGPLLPSFFFH